MAQDAPRPVIVPPGASSTSWACSGRMLNIHAPAGFDRRLMKD